jgi:hypothetical protein
MKNFLMVTLSLILFTPRCLFGQPEDPSLLGNAPISFYGKVIDQESRPLSDVTVKVSVVVNFLATPTRSDQRLDFVIVKTDAQGKFSVQNVSGSAIQIEEIKKDGYKLSPKVGKPSFSYYPAKVQHDPENPNIFKMWKLMGGEVLIQPPVWNGNVSCDGTTNRFDLRTGSRSASGDLRIICKRTPLQVLPRLGRKFDYSFEISVLGGGIQTTEDEITYLAPGNGYLPVFSVSQTANDPKWYGRVKREFYFKTPEGHYGTLSVDWYATQQNPTHLDWNCAINPSGSRNLEPQ